MWNTIVDEMVSNALKEVQEAKRKAEEGKAEEEPNNLKERLLKRAVYTKGEDSYEIEQLVLMYKDLAPEDVTGPISIKMMREFLKEVVEKEDPSGYAKVRRYYDFKNPLSESKMKKLGNFVENFWNRFRTVEYCYRYSKSFHEMAKRIAPKLDAPESMGVVERCKWLRLWEFLIKDQSFFWKDIEKDGLVHCEESERFDREVYLTPEVMISLEKREFSELPDGSILLDMLKAFISLYPENIQKDIIRFAELDKNEPDCLRAGVIRNNLKKKLFPVMWVSGLGSFFTKPGIQALRVDFLELAVKAYKNGGVEKLPVFKQDATDAYNHFKTKKFNCYELGSFDSEKKINGQQIQYVFAVTSENELKMFAEVYKWISAHEDFRFGKEGEEKTLEEYGLKGMLDEKPSLEEMMEGWILDMNLANSEEDVNLSILQQLASENEFLFEEYYEGNISGDDVFTEIGFSSDFQARVCCSKTAKIVASEASKLSEALKRVKMFGETTAIKSDIIYLAIFKYLMLTKPDSLPKNAVKLYGKIF